MDPGFFLPKIAQLDTKINLLTLEFLFAVCFLQLTQIGFHCLYIVYSTALLGFLIASFISSYSLNTLFTETNSS